MLLHGLTATRRYVLQGSRPARAGRLPPDRLRRARPRRVRTRPRAHRLRVRRPGGRPAPRARPARAGAAGAGRQLDGRRHGAGAGPRGARAGVRAGADHARPTTARRAPIPPTSRNGRRWRARWTRRTSRPSWTCSGVNRLPESCATCARRAVRQRLERHEHLAARWPTPCAWCPARRLRRPGRAGRARRARAGGGQPRRDRPRPPARRGEEYARRLPRAKLVVEDEGESPLAWRGRSSRERSRFLRGGPRLP